VNELGIAEPRAGLISLEDFKKLCSRPLKELISKAGKPCILHICGRSNHLIEEMANTGAQALSFDHNVNLVEAAERVPNSILMGNYSPVKLVMYKQDVVRKEISSLLEETKHIRNLIFSTGCDVPYEAPIENITILVELAKKLKL